MGTVVFIIPFNLFHVRKHTFAVGCENFRVGIQFKLFDEGLLVMPFQIVNYAFFKTMLSTL
ncbi:hypothetical protein DDZ16_05150 [Marinilabilia rubra]|uniref:Uncharacterized protein n=1 Tax=Marinilabilia rubra TaxID=2162893 RepID=A0A2U2BB92_9BACT|nr:hypothetical protein DDZ16_05150 [Marinilabilia rubra]